MSIPHRLPVALLAAPLFALALSACAHQLPPLHLHDSAADYSQLGLGDTVVAKEDGRRTPTGTDEYEWWYLDGVAKDGTVVVVIFSDNWLPGGHSRKVMIEVTPPGQPTKQAAFETKDPGGFSSERADVRIGNNRFEGDLAHYSISVDPKDANGLGCQLQLDRRVPSYRPGTGVFASGEDFFAWVVAVPEGALTGTLFIDGRTQSFEGSGYHDHNWGNVAPWALMRNWWWGRGEVDGRTVVMAELRPAPGRGDKPMALLYVAGPDGVVVKSQGDTARLAEGPATLNDDPRHSEKRASSVTLETTAGVSARFERHGAPITSADLLAGRSGFVRMIAAMAGRSPWYTRWRSTVITGTNGSSKQGEGTIEFMNFE